MKKVQVLVLPLLLLLAACSVSGPALIAALGIAGSGLTLYCASAPAGDCPPAVTAYGEMIISEAVADATIWESGATTAEKIAEIVVNLDIAVDRGRALAGVVSGPTQQRVTAIVGIVVELLPLVSALAAENPVVRTVGEKQGIRVTRVVRLPALSHGDRRALERMQENVKRGKH